MVDKVGGLGKGFQQEDPLDKKGSDEFYAKLDNASDKQKKLVAALAKIRPALAKAIQARRVIKESDLKLLNIALEAGKADDSASRDQDKIFKKILPENKNKDLLPEQAEDGIPAARAAAAAAKARFDLIDNHAVPQRFDAGMPDLIFPEYEKKDIKQDLGFKAYTASVPGQKAIADFIKKNPQLAKKAEELIAKLNAGGLKEAMGQLGLNSYLNLKNPKKI